MSWLKSYIFSGCAVWWVCWQIAGDHRAMLLLIPFCQQDIPVRLLDSAVSPFGLGYHWAQLIQCQLMRNLYTVVLPSCLHRTKSFLDIISQRNEERRWNKPNFISGVKEPTIFQIWNAVPYGHRQFTVALPRRRILQNLWQGKYGCDTMAFLVEHFNGYDQLSRWDLTFLEQEFFTTYLI